MTEEIIVNGLDVSECYADNKMMKDGLYCFWEGGNCEDNEYCYYKECERLKQENEKLKGVICQQSGEKFALEHDRFVYKNALEEIREIVMESKPVEEPISQSEFTVRRMDLQTNKLIRVLAKTNEVLGNE